MKLKSLNIRHEDYGSNKGGYEMSITFDNQYSSQTMKLPGSISTQVLDLCGKFLIAASVDLANNIKPAIEAAQTPALKGPTDASTDSDDGDNPEPREPALGES